MKHRSYDKRPVRTAPLRGHFFRAQSRKKRRVFSESDAEYAERIHAEFAALFAALSKAAGLVHTITHVLSNGMKEGETRKLEGSDNTAYMSALMDLQAKAAGLKPSLARLDALVIQHLHSPPGKWGIDLLRELDELIGANETEKSCRRLRQRGNELENLRHILRGLPRVPSPAPDAGQLPGDELPWPEYMSASDIADRLELPRDATRKKLSA